MTNEPARQSDRARIIDGVAAAAALTDAVAAETADLVARGIKPGLAVVLVGDDPASQVYVGAKGRMAQTCGFHSVQHTLPVNTEEAELLALVSKLNDDPAIHGILVQMPLPAQISATRVVESILPRKDVDGLTPWNAGLLGIGDLARALIPCTPAGIMRLLEQTSDALGRPLRGQAALVIGRSQLVGRPVAQLLVAADCTVTVAHSKSRDLPALVGGADIVIAAIGRPRHIPGDWIKPGAIVIDVGINRVPGEGLTKAGKPRTRLVGDVDFATAVSRAAAITPVPGGVGPMTIAMLMANTLKAARLAAG